MSVIAKNNILSSNALSNVVMVAFGVALMTIASQVSIPIKPVLISMHTVGMLLIAFCFQPQRARQVMLSYLILGACGAPVFSYFGATERLIGPTGGYLFGMLAGTYVISYAREYFGEGGWLYKQVLTIIGLSIVYLLGVAQLALFVGASSAISLGFLPFIKMGVLKAIFTSYSIHFIKGGSK